MELETNTEEIYENSIENLGNEDEKEEPRIDEINIEESNAENKEYTNESETKEGTMNDNNDEIDLILSSSMNISNPSDSVKNDYKFRNSEDLVKQDSFVTDANAKVLLDTLAPQIEKNEKDKRKHKKKLITYITIFLGSQLLFIAALVFIVIIPIMFFHANGNDFSYNMLKMILGFFATYVTSVIVELIVILKYIVKNIFDTSLSDLMEKFHI